MSATTPTASGLALRLVAMYGEALRMTHDAPPSLRDSAQRNLTAVHAILLDYIATLEVVAPRSTATANAHQSV